MRARTSTTCAAVWIALLAPGLAAADSLCPGPKEARAAEAQLRKAEEAEKAGRWVESFRAASSVDQDCVGSPPRVKAIRLRTAGKAAEEAERKPDLEDAFRWYQAAERLTDADRVELALVDARPGEEKAVTGALEWFKRRGDEKALGRVRAIAGRNADRALAEEEQAFARVGHDSLAELGKARTWLLHAGAGEARARERAERRGDALAAEDGRQGLALALRYYQVAGKEEKRRAVLEKARRLGEAHAKNGEAAVAADYLALAGDRGRAASVRKEADEREQKAEKKRQKGFKKDTATLEQELGL